jgi:hypothetical protein
VLPSLVPHAIVEDTNLALDNDEKYSLPSRVDRGHRLEGADEEHPCRLAPPGV